MNTTGLMRNVKACDSETNSRFTEMIPESDVWAVIHKIESATKKDGLKDLSKQELCNLLSDVYDMLGAIVM